ncbi:Imm32 family immunity protein [Phaeospirillum tilakii]|uniref:Imm32 family immunity protein n=1 Tax=Phaeospirillum tilakii TaxID=741673 RepID=A0ABW5CGA4_9PROT
MLTVEYSEESQEVAICFDYAGQRLLENALKDVPEGSHSHLMTESWGGWDLDEVTVGEEARLIHHLRLVHRKYAQQSQGAEQGVLFTDGISRIELRPAGPPALGTPTRIKASTGPFVAEVEAEAWDYEKFRNGIARIHETLSGEAELTFVEGGHSIRVTGDGQGGVEVKVVISDGRAPCQAFLTVTITLNQSYLPDVIHAIRRQFS